MTRDWGEDLALFESAYPGRDWRCMTIATFEAYLNAAVANNARLAGAYTEEMHKRWDIARMRRELLTKALMYPSFFPEVEL